MIDVEIKISYFNSETSESVEFVTTETDFKCMTSAKVGAAKLLEAEYQDAWDDGMMPDTWYYEVDYLLDQADHAMLIEREVA